MPQPPGSRRETDWLALPLTGRLRRGELPDVAVDPGWADRITPDWAFRDATGRGVRVCVVDSGIDLNHPLVGHVAGSFAVCAAPGGSLDVSPADDGDSCGHGTACAGLIRSVAPECALYSVRVLMDEVSGSADALVAGLAWAIRQGFDVVSLSLSTSLRQHAGVLQALADEAYFRNTVLVASAHNSPIESFPWRFSSVISVGRHAEPDPAAFFYNPSPPAEFFAHGCDVEVAWPGGGRNIRSGNSLATSRMAGYCALLLSKHALTPFQVKSVLYSTAANARTSDC